MKCKLPSNAFCALSGSSWFLSGCTKMDNCKIMGPNIENYYTQNRAKYSLWHTRKIRYIITWRDGGALQVSLYTNRPKSFL